MPRRAKVMLLPAPIREELDNRLIASAFSNYVGLAAWLRKKGFAIGKTSLHRYGLEMQRGRSATAVAGRVVLVMIDPGAKQVWTYIARRGGAEVRRTLEKIATPLTLDGRRATAAEQSTRDDQRGSRAFKQR